jgi:signal transduction histidine kinase
MVTTMQHRESNTLALVRQWAGRRAQWLTTIAVFCGTFAFSFGSELPRMTLFANAVLAGLSAGTGWSSYRYPRFALAALVVLCGASSILSASFAALELVGVFVLFQVTWRSEIKPGTVAVVGFVSLTMNDFWLRRNTGLPWNEPTVLYPLILTALGVGLGFQGRRLRHQNSELIALQHVNWERAVLSERQRIARDLHDVAAHHLSALVVQNKLARRVATTEALEEAADFSSKTAGEALDALRQVVGVLSSDSPLDPQPTLSDLPQMFDRLQVAGLVLHASPKSFAGFPALRRDIELAIVRITQEALTNVLKHRGPGNAWFDLTHTSKGVSLTIVDDGNPSEPVRRSSDGLRTGYGLINMTERAKSAGGILAAKASLGGGWRVEATFPKEPSYE